MHLMATYRAKRLKLKLTGLVLQRRAGLSSFTFSILDISIYTGDQ